MPETSKALPEFDLIFIEENDPLNYRELPMMQYPKKEKSEAFRSWDPCYSDASN